MNESRELLLPPASAPPPLFVSRFDENFGPLAARRTIPEFFMNICGASKCPTALEFSKYSRYEFLDRTARLSRWKIREGKNRIVEDLLELPG